MHRRSKFLLAGLAAALALGAAAGTASARRIEFSSQNIRITWRELIYKGGEQEIRCPVTYEGSFHSRTISKVSGSLVGYIYRAQISGCSGGSERYLTETLPWHIQYNSFQGVLPRITSVKLAIVGLSWLVEEVVAFGGPCLFRATQERPLFGTLTFEAGGTRWNEDEASQLPKASGGILCPREIGFGVGWGSATTQEGRELLVRLVQ